MEEKIDTKAEEIFAGHKVNTQKLIAFLYAAHEQLVSEKRKSNTTFNSPKGNV